ncbi:sel1 repeat family protein [Thauera sp.]|jgi:TPR repeat protein|uniref:tetratricopeptide repeat protein n=1 Tax=Thauera sp. TaxID=1905334 RepID=UPI002A361A0F|nr:sel1 repeat family protein [Thauera sp.]MDX9887107.1 sel1 repeat family protein [Thauera sp.]
MNARRCLAALLLFQSCAVLAQPLDDDELAGLAARPSIGLYKAYAEFKMAHYDSARSIWQALAEKGVAEAWFHLGILAEDGLGEVRDGRAAVERYRRGAHAGSTKAQYRLGLLYLEGGPVEPDREQARYWLAVAAANGDDEAARRLDALRRADPPQ